MFVRLWPACCCSWAQVQTTTRSLKKKNKDRGWSQRTWNTRTLSRNKAVSVFLPPSSSFNRLLDIFKLYSSELLKTTWQPKQVRGFYLHREMCNLDELCAVFYSFVLSCKHHYSKHGFKVQLNVILTLANCYYLVSTALSHCF